MSEASSSLDPRTPVIIGVGQILNRVDQGSDPYEPAKLMTQALLAAQADSGADAVLASAQVVAAVPTISWRYSNRELWFVNSSDVSMPKLGMPP